MPCRRKYEATRPLCILKEREYFFFLHFITTGTLLHFRTTGQRLLSHFETKIFLHFETTGPRPRVIHWRSPVDLGVLFGWQS